MLVKVDKVNSLIGSDNLDWTKIVKGGRGQGIREDRGKSRTGVYQEETIGKVKTLVFKDRVVATWTEGVVVVFQRVKQIEGKRGLTKVGGQERVQIELE